MWSIVDVSLRVLMTMDYVTFEIGLKCGDDVVNHVGRDCITIDHRTVE